MVSSKAVLFHCPDLNRLEGGWFLRMPGRGRFRAEIEQIQRVEKAGKTRRPGLAFGGCPVKVRANALVAQLDRASDFESEGREFESLRARQSTLPRASLTAAAPVFAQEE
jgi:hypothetical protein